MKILFIGDVFGKPGRNMITKYLPVLKDKYKFDFTIINAENSSHGKGLTHKNYEQLINAGADFITMGNHTWFKSDILDLLTTKNNIIRPMNLKTSHKHHSVGSGTKEIQFKNKKIRITNLLGNSVRFYDNQENCFCFFDNFLSELDKEGSKPDIHIVDLHAETTSEKNAFLWSFNGRVSAILGTHTHIPTADAVITKDKTAYISDVGMTGPSCGVIGGEKSSIINKFFNPEEKFILDVEPGPAQLCAVIMEFDDHSNEAKSIEQIIIKEGFEKLSKTTAIEKLV